MVCVVVCAPAGGRKGESVLEREIENTCFVMEFSQHVPHSHSGRLRVLWQGHKYWQLQQDKLLICVCGCAQFCMCIAS